MTRRTILLFAATALLVGSSGIAGARDYIVSGQMQQFFNEVPRPTLDAYGKVSQTGSGLPTLRIPRKVISAYSNVGVVPIPSPSLFQFTGMGISYAQAGTFSSGGGPGSLAWCPGRANTVNPNCIVPGQATGPVPNARLVITAGPNQYGGTMGALRNLAGSFSFLGGGTHNGYATIKHRANPPYTPVQLVQGGYNPGTLSGGMTAGGITFGIHHGLVSAPKYTYGAVLGAAGSIQTPGKLIGTGTGNADEIQTGTGFGWTTGTISASNLDNSIHATGSTSAPGYTYWTLSGYNNRTELGAGNIQMVSGGFLHVPSTINDSISRNFLTITLAEKVPTMGPAGFAAAAALIIVVAGYAFRRKF